MAVKDEVEAFLNEMQSLVRADEFYIVDRVKNRQALVALGLSLENQKNELLNLNHANYSSGPFEDRDRPGKIWVFGTHIDQTEVYIKLKIVESSMKKRVVCISFHPAEFPLDYPHRH